MPTGQTALILTILSGLAALCALGAAAAGLAAPDIYRPAMPERFIPGALSQDTVTLVAAPAVLACLAAIRRGLRSGWLVWAGLVGYLAYGYGLYAFDRVYNPLFLIYVAILALSGWSLLAFVRTVDVVAIVPRPGRSPPRRTTALLFLALVALFLALWLSILLPAMAERVPPPGNSIFVFDLVLMLPLLGLSALALLRAAPLGDLLAPILLVKTATLGISVFIGTLYGSFFGQPLALEEVATYAFMGFLPLAGAWPWFRALDVSP